MDACKAQGVEAPTWCSDGGFVTITFKRSHKAESDTRQGEVPLNHQPSSVQVQKLILSMGEDYMTMSEIMSNMGFKHRTSFRENYFLLALKDGAIEPLYPEQPNHPKQKYRLTESVKKWLKNNV